MSQPPQAKQDGVSSDASLKGYEPSDVSSSGIGIFGVGLALGIAVVFGSIFVLFHIFAWSDAQQDNLRRRQEPAAASLVHLAADYRGPLLQVAAEEDLKTLLVARDVSLNRYGWVDKQAGTVRIPINRAMDIIAQRGLPPTSPGVTLEDIQRQRSQRDTLRIISPP